MKLNSDFYLYNLHHFDLPCYPVKTDLCKTLVGLSGWIRVEGKPSCSVRWEWVDEHVGWLCAVVRSARFPPRIRWTEKSHVQPPLLNLQGYKGTSCWIKADINCGYFKTVNLAFAMQCMFALDLHTYTLTTPPLSTEITCWTALDCTSVDKTCGESD